MVWQAWSGRRLAGGGRHRRGASVLRCRVAPGWMRRHDRLRRGRTPPRGNTRFVFKICRIFPGRRYCHEAGGWFGLIWLIFVLGTRYEVLRGGRGRAVTRPAPARGRAWPVRAAPLRNTQCRSISTVSSRRDPGAPRLQNPHPPLRFRFAQPRSTQYFVLGTEKEGSLRSHAARRLRRLAPSTSYYVLRTGCLDSSVEFWVLGAEYPN